MRIFALATSLLVAFSIFLPATNTPSVYAQTQIKHKTTPKQAPKPVFVQVQPGDTLTGIATDHQTTYPRLYDANPSISNPDLIYPGDQLRVPGPDENLPQRSVQEALPASTAYSAASSAPVANYATPPDAGVWAELAACESGGNWAENTGNGYYGGLQFTLGTWLGNGGGAYASRPDLATPDQQIAVASSVQANRGWAPWPACSAKLGL